MDISREELEQTYKALEDGEILQRLASGSLTEMADSVARYEAARRRLKVDRTTTTPENAVVAIGTEADLVCVARFSQPTEAHVLCQFLNAHEVFAAVVGAHQMQVITPWDANTLGGARVMVPQALAAEAMDLLKGYRSGDFAISEDFDPGVPGS
jgi:hypothetical protein